MSPNIENERNAKVTANNVKLEYQYEIYFVSCCDQIIEVDGKYIIIESVLESVLGNLVATVEFNILFKAKEYAVVSVNYIHNLGGYPNLELVAKSE